MVREATAAAPARRPFARDARRQSKRLQGSWRLAGLLRAERLRIVLVLAWVVSVVFAIVGPKMLGAATNQLFEGVIGGQLPAGVTQEQAVAALRAQGPGPPGRHAVGHDAHPGVGVDFGALGRTLGCWSPCTCSAPSSAGGSST